MTNSRLDVLADRYDIERLASRTVERPLVESLGIAPDLHAAGLRDMTELVAFVELVLERHDHSDQIIAEMGALPLDGFMGPALLDAIEATPGGVSRAFRKALAVTRSEFEPPAVRVRVERLIGQ